MKLLLATDEYLPHAGGVPRVLLETSRRLQARGHNLSILTFERDASLSRCDEIAGVGVRRIPLSGRLSAYPRALIGSCRAFRAAAAHDSYDLLHVHLPLVGVGAQFDGRLRHVPQVYTFYGPWHQEMEAELRAKPLRPAASAIYRRYVSLLCHGLKAWQGRVMRYARRVVVLSEHSQQEVAALFPQVRPENLCLIPGGVDVGRFRPTLDPRAARARLALPPNRTILLTVRRLVPRMGLENLLHAFARLREERYNLYLVVVGRGRSKDALCTLAGRLGISRHVHFAGFIPEEDLPAYYQAADLFVLPTQALEGFGLITVEALASGLPVVGTPIGSTSEILGHFDRRFLTDGTEPEALVDGIRRGLDLVEKENSTLAEQCRAFAVEHYDWECIVDRYEELYGEVLEEACAV